MYLVGFPQMQQSCSLFETITSAFISILSSLNNSIETQANIKIGVEEVVGKIGDETLYRKTYHVTNVSFKGDYTVDNEINKNIATMIKAEGSLRMSGLNNWISLGSAMGSDYYTKAELGNTVLGVTMNWSNYTCIEFYLIIYYTKNN